MAKIISGGLVLWIVLWVFSQIGQVLPADTFTLGEAFKVLGVILMWSIITLMFYQDFLE